MYVQYVSASMYSAVECLSVLSPVQIFSAGEIGREQLFPRSTSDTIAEQHHSVLSCWTRSFRCVRLRLLVVELQCVIVTGCRPVWLPSATVGRFIREVTTTHL